MTNGVYNSIKLKHKLLAAAMKTGNVQKMEAYKIYRNLLNRTILQTKKSYNKSVIETASNKSKAIWNIIHNITHKNRKKRGNNINIIKTQMIKD